MMEQKMFCYQCEQTAGGKGCCGKAGVCGKTAVTAEIQDKISGALIGLARTARSIEKETEVYDIITKGLFTTVTNVNFDDDDLNKLIGEIEAKAVILSSCGCGGKAEPYAPYDITAIWADNEDIRALKSMLLFGLRGMAAYAYHAAQLDRKNDEMAVYFCKGLAALAGNFKRSAHQKTVVGIVIKVNVVYLKLGKIPLDTIIGIFGDYAELSVFYQVIFLIIADTYDFYFFKLSRCPFGSIRPSICCSELREINIRISCAL